MQRKGVILIVDDRIEEKIGVFQEYLKVDGYTIRIAETLEDANKELSTLLRNNSLDGIILDFSFPVDSKDSSVHVDGIPNGVSLFRKHEFKIKTQRIPVVINTTGDEEYKRKYLGNIEDLGTPTYNVNHEANPLAQTTNREMVIDILKMFNDRTEQRILNSQVQPNKSWNMRGKSVIQRPDGSFAYSRYDGD